MMIDGDVAQQARAGLSASSNSSSATSTPSSASSTPPPRSRPEALDALIGTSLQGRSTALRCARDEALRLRTPWTREQVRRFKYLPDDAPPHDFTSRTLIALLEQALVGHCRRIEQAMGEAATARLYAWRAEHEGEQRLESALRSFRDPNAEHLTRQALAAQHHRAGKEVLKLCNALQTLEAEMEAAQHTHVAAMRCLATRLLAQHDASAATVLDELEAAERENTRLEAARRASVETMACELERAEIDAAGAISYLEAENFAQKETHARRTREMRAAHEAEVKSQRAALDATERRLTVERKARRWEVGLVRSEMQDEMASEAAKRERRHASRMARADTDLACVRSAAVEEEAHRWTQYREAGALRAKLASTRGELAERTAAFAAHVASATATERELRAAHATLTKATDAERAGFLEKVALLEGQLRLLRKRLNGRGDAGKPG